MNTKLKSAFVIALLTGVTFHSFAQGGAQSRADLEKERASIQKEIEDVKNSLEETKKNKKETLGQLALLQRKLRLRQAAVQNINDQIGFIQNDMNMSWRDILKLRKELDTLRKQYALSVVYAYKNRSNYDFMNFIFSATSFNDAIKRVTYLKSYRAYREERADNIQKTQKLLQGKIDGLKIKREEKDQVLQKQNKERQVLEEEKKEKDQVVSKLQTREKELKKEMNAKQRQDQKLNNSIAAAIRRAREEAIRDAKKKDAEEKATAAKTNSSVSPGSNPVTAAPEVKKPVKAPSDFNTRSDIALSDNFEKNKGRLPWPVDAGNVSMSFGVHEYIKGIKYNNQGLTIDAKEGTTVKAVFEGVVQNVINVGEVVAVIVRHGKYFTTYSNLSAASVTKNEQVQTGQTLGKVGDAAQLEFILSDEKDHKFDPEKWLRR